MSRIGKLPIEIPAGVEVKIDGNTVTAKGPLGTETVTIRPELKVEQQDNKVVVSRLNDDRKSRSLHASMAIPHGHHRRTQLSLLSHECHRIAGC